MRSMELRLNPTTVPLLHPIPHELLYALVCQFDVVSDLECSTLE